MFKLVLKLFLVVLVAVGVCVFYNSQRTFEAKFENIDGLPNGAPVTALGVRVGKVVKTTPVEDGIIVKIRITNNSFPYPPPGSKLAITSFRPGQGRLLEVIPPEEKLDKDTAWLVKEPVTSESWLHASLELVENLQDISKTIIKNVTPENLSKVRILIAQTSDTLEDMANSLRTYERNLDFITKRLSIKVDEANQLVNNLRNLLDSLNNLVKNDKLVSSLKGDVKTFSDKVAVIGEAIKTPDFKMTVEEFKTNILDHLNELSTTLTDAGKSIQESDIKQDIANFNEHVNNLNIFYDNVLKHDVKTITKESVEKAREAVTNASKITKELANSKN